MKARFAIVPLLALTFPSSAALAANTCDLPETDYIGPLHSALGQRAVEAIDLAAGPRTTKSDGALARRIASDAPVSLGSGDVGRPLGTGAEGLRRMVREMRADRYRQFGWDTIPTPVKDACGEQTIEMEFTDTTGQHVYPVKFTFREGRITQVSGWSRSFVAGPIAAVRD
ncbi:hypothetical protein MTR62_02190 [Novosphingobium sp. 1949]|uniref:Uncharacterized protein n=1 Tax=Novosphingobium organovorum TaxID=2930092 RepID=A0ABT0B945_9SPHN|nr:hypothetical protein [Novosphingobium organovorum]MCJ2181523.1 hypothetical protein [Novosphingobium organovorum]